MSAEQERDAETLYRCAEQLFKAQADEQCRITQELCNERVERLTERIDLRHAVVLGHFQQ